MATVRDLLAQPALGLRVLVGADRVDTPLRWVATSEHEDPTPFLQGGELLLTTGMRLPRGAQAVQEYVDRLAGAGVAALGFGVGLVHARVPIRLRRAAENAGLVLIEVDRPTPFVAVSKALSDRLAREEYAETVRLAQSQQELARTAVRHGAAAVVRSTSRLLDGWVLLLDREGRVRHAHPAAASRRAEEFADELAVLRRGGPAASSLVTGGEHVSLHPLAAERWVRGFLVIGTTRSPTSADRALMGAAGALLAVGTRPRGSAEKRRDAAILRLLRDGLRVEQDVLAALGGAVLARPSIRVVAATAERRSLETWASAAVDEAGDVCLAAVEQTEALLVLADAHVVQQCVDQAAAHPSLHVGVSEPCSPADVATAIEQAERARTIARSRGVSAIAHADAMQGLLRAVSPAAAAAFAHELLAPLRDYHDRTGIDLVATLHVWLRYHGHFDPAAQELGLHRHTLRRRIRKAGSLLGRSLDDPTTRMELWFAINVSPQDRAHATGSPVS